MPFIFFDVFHYICLPQNVFMEEALIKKHLKQGDERAFKYLYEQHYALLCRFAAQLTNDISLAEEMVDDVIFYLWEHHWYWEITNAPPAKAVHVAASICPDIRNSCSKQS